MHTRHRSTEKQRSAKEPEKLAVKLVKNESVYSNLTLNESNLFKCSVCLRIISVFVVQTYFVPDEYWQSLEIAHHTVFGYGYKTWEWTEGIRSYFYPFLFVPVYYLLKVLSLDLAYLLITLPRVFQAVLTSTGDYFLYAFAKRVFGSRIAFYAYTLHLSSWFVFYNGSRTLTNTTEMTLIIIGLGSYKWRFLTCKETKEDSRPSLIFGLICCGFSCLVRPTASLIWLPVIVYELFYDIFRKKSFEVLINGFLTAMILFVLSTLVDSMFYGKLIFVHWNFFRFNVLEGMSSFYGIHPWHWYVTQGLPVVLFSSLPLVVFAAFKGEVLKQGSWPICFLALVYILGLSFVSHKEFRFLLPIMPFLHCISAKALHDCTDSPASKHRAKVELYHGHEDVNVLTVRKKSLALLVCIGIINLTVALYFGLVHQRGTIDVMRFLRYELKERHAEDAVLFLMPCHSTPYYSHLHVNVSMRFLECHPSKLPNYIDEAELFYRDPGGWLRLQYDGTKKPFPTHIVLFDVLLNDNGVFEFLRKSNFFECMRYFHTHFPEGRIGSHVLAFCRKTSNRT